MRYSYGWQKKEARLTIEQFHQITGLSKRTIYDVLRRLIKHQLLTLVDTNTYSLQKDYDKWQVDQRRYKPLGQEKELCKSDAQDCAKTEANLSESEDNSIRKQRQDCPKANTNSSESEVTFVRKQIKNHPSVTAKKSNNNSNLEELAQSLHKDIYKDISLRERIFERLKSQLTDLSEQDLEDLRLLCNRHPERADFFLYLCETFKLDPVYVRNPMAYIKSLRPINFPSLSEREAVTIEKAVKQAEVDLCEYCTSYYYSTEPPCDDCPLADHSPNLEECPRCFGTGFLEIWR